MKSNVKLFQQLYIANQRRAGDLDTFFKHENSSVPPSLSKDGKLRPGDKSDLLDCLINDGMNCLTEKAAGDIDALIIEGAVLVNIVRPNGQRSFKEYVEQRILPVLEKALSSKKRVDIVWDIYKQSSLKSQTRQARGEGVTHRLSDNAPMPKNWSNYLRNSHNKTALFHYIASKIGSDLFQRVTPKTVVTTYDDSVLSNDEDLMIGSLAPCNHEEGDYRVLLHALHMSQCGFEKVIVNTCDTDVVVIAVSSFHKLGLSELWIRFGTGKHTRFLPIHEIVLNVGPERARCLGIFHALSGCDQTSFLSTCGKKKAWNTWMKFSDLTDTMLVLAQQPVSMNTVTESMAVIERFVCLMYSAVTNEHEVNKCRRYLFTKGRQLESLPPTQDALFQHVLRAVYQGSFVWGQATIAMQILPKPTDWGWEMIQDEFAPMWGNLPPIAKALRELTTCGCVTCIANRCSCMKVDLPCTELCKCNGEHEQD